MVDGAQHVHAVGVFLFVEEGFFVVIEKYLFANHEFFTPLALLISWSSDLKTE